jgi:3'-5' exoribonuclease
MAGKNAAVVRLSDLRDGQQAEFFALLAEKTRGTKKGTNDTFFKCFFRDKHAKREAPVWPDSPLLPQAESWTVGTAFRIKARAEDKKQFGLQLHLLAIRPVTEQDAADGYDFAELVERSDRSPDELFQKVLDLVERGIDDAPLKQLVLKVLNDNAVPFKKHHAAQSMHHAYTGGLVEHVWSMTRTACWLAEHYGRYYHQLDPPLNEGLVIAATVLHDIGKLRELEYDPVESRYTKEGTLVGHVLIGRDMVREAAATIDGFSEETLLLLEHAILSHHGTKAFGAPVEPATLEAILVSHIDILDAKMNAAARARLISQPEDEFTGKVYALDNRRIYKGIPTSAPIDGHEEELD